MSSDAPLDVAHLDMDCFFAAVEALDDPSLRHKPVIVGGVGPRGVVASCSYEARATGVRSAMSMAEARRRCPPALVVAGRHGRYGEVSKQLHDVLHEFTPVIEPISLDEAFLDLSGGHRVFGPSEAIGRAMRERVRQRLGLECSVGIGRSKLIAKLASREAKPRPSPSGPIPGRGVVLVRADEELSFLHPRPVRALWGVGPKTAERLAAYGLRTIGDVAAVEVSALERLVGTAVGRQLHELSWGRDERPVRADLEVKSIGQEETFPTDQHDRAELHREVIRLSDAVGTRLRANEMTGRTVNLKVRFFDFVTITRAHTLPGPLLSALEIARVADALLEGVEVSRGVRLLGVSVSSLEPVGHAGGRQLSLLESDGGLANGRPAARSEVEAAVDAVRRRYGVGAVGPATVLDPSGGLRVREEGERQWG